MNEQEIRQLVQEMINQNKQSDRFSTQRGVSLHKHTGTDSPKINQNDIIPLIRGNGTITMAQSTAYKLNLGNIKSVPVSVTFYGGALHNTGSAIDIHAMVVGSAQLGTNQQFQPQTSTSVIIGPVITNIIQGSATMVMTNGSFTFDGTGLKTGGSNATSYIKNSQGHIVYVEDAGGSNILAMATVTSYDNSAITIVTQVASGWSISGLWVIN